MHLIRHVQALLRRLGRAAVAAVIGCPAVQRATWVCAGMLLVLIQGQTAAQAGELPQVLTGANARFTGAQTPVVTGNDMVINQFADKATLHWQSFNIGAENQVEFKQPSASAVALNRIFDAAPSQVNGKLKANGQVYLINQNGIVFGQGAQVNTQSLVASTLDIDDRVYEQIGFVNAINEPSGALPAFDSFGHPMGEIHVGEGAKLESAKGGRILIFAPTIVNEGTITTPEGQQVLAASQDKVLIAASNDADLRGLLVEVSTGGDVTNLGSLIAERGNISLLGLAVNQEGIARATTSVSLNGSIRLMAQDMNGTINVASSLPRTPSATRGGDVRLGSGSVTEVVPDTTPDKDGKAILAVDAQSQPLSRIDIAGKRVRLESGSTVTSTGGDIRLTAAVNPFQPLLQLRDPTATDSEVVVEAGAVVDASGDDTTVVSVARNVVNVEARGNELADSPVQRNGPIRNKTLQVDLRRGTDFLNIEGGVASIRRSANERQSAGGTINVTTEGRFRLEEGARLDVSGGQVTYTEGLVSTSRLQQTNGKVVGISAADPDQTYVGLVGNAVTREAGYVEGKDAGGLNVTASGIELSGELRAGSVQGANQRRRAEDLATANLPTFARPYDEAPLGGALALSLWRSGQPELIVGHAPAGPPPGAPPLVLSMAQILASGAGRIGLGNKGGAVILNDPLELPAWSELTLTGTQASVLSDVRIPGGELRLNSTHGGISPPVVLDQDLLVRIDGAVDLSGTWVNDNPLLNTSRPTAPIVLDGGRLIVDSGFSIDVSADSRLDVSAGAYRAADGGFKGGRGGSMGFATGTSAVNPFLGARLALAGEMRAFGFTGGGSLTIEAERIEIVPEPGVTGDEDVLLDGSRQFGLREVSDVQGNSQFILEVGAGTFQQGGFSSYSLSSSRSDLAVMPGAAVRLRTANYLLTGNASSLAPSGTDVASLATPVLNPDFMRSPAALTLSTDESLANAIGPVADLSVGAGASIVADAGSSIRLRSTTSMFIDGGLDAPAGQIRLELGDGAPTFTPEQMIWLGAGASLTANGTALIDTLDPLGIRRGEVLDAGRVSVRASQGSIVGAAGARIAVDGAVASLDTGFGIPVRTQVGSAAGTIELIAAESLLYQGMLSGAAPAGFAVPGGRLTVALDPTNRKVPPLLGPDATPRGPNRLIVQDFTGTLPGAGMPVDPSLYSTGFVPLAQLRAGGFSSLDLIARSSAVGTSDVGAPVPDTPQSLPVIEFPNDLDLHLDRSIRLDAAILKTEGAQVALTAPYVSIGYSDTRVRLDGTIPDKTSTSNPQDTTTPIRLTPTAGPGALTVTGELIELVGESVTQGFGDAAAGRDGVTLSASGDVRMRGVRATLKDDYAGLFRTAGNLVIDAERIYPTTLTSFEVRVEGAGGRISLAGGGGHGAPLSVGGTLDLAADEIVQGGALFAPLGEVNLLANSTLRFTAGSLTSTSAAGVNAPFFRTEPGGALILPAPDSGQKQIVFAETVTNPAFERALPEQHINLAAPVVELQPGSQFDINGGSDVRATQFLPGPGGSRDILLADLAAGAAVEPNGSFAIVPGISGFAPYDPLETPSAESVQGLRIGDTLVLEDGLQGLPAGEYAILPARYALFGGFLVTPAAGTQDIAAGQSLQLLDGTPILAGRLGVAGSDAADLRSQGFAVETGSHVRQRAEYLETRLDDFYTEGILRAPRDAGNLVISAGDSLQLQGELIRGVDSHGLGAAVDIASAAALSVVNELTGTNGIELRATDLTNLGADSLLLGGSRIRETDGLHLDATSSMVTVEAGVALEVPELLLVGGRIVVDGSAAQSTRLASTSAPTGQSAGLVIDDDAAVLAVSDRQLTLQRTSGVAGASSVTISADATLEARGGLVLDAAGDVDAAGRLEGGEGTISLGAGRISIGATDGQVIDGGLILSNADLHDIAGSDLRLRSNGAIDVYGEVGGDATEPLAFRRLALDAPGIRGNVNEDVTAVLRADLIELGNSSGTGLTAPVADPAPGSVLELQAGKIQLGDGAVTIQGYGETRIAATSAVLLTGNHSLQTAGNLSIDTPLIMATAARSGSIDVSGHLDVTGGDASATVPDPGLGAVLRISASDIDFAGRIVLPSGEVHMTQEGDPAAPVPGAGLRLAGSAIIDVAGDAVKMGPRVLGTPGGLIELGAQTGDLDLSAALLDVSAPSAGGEAGELRLRAPSGAVMFSPGLHLAAGDAAGTTGRFVLDARSVVNSDAAVDNPVTSLTDLLGGFRDSIALRLRQQDVTIGAGSTIAARQVRLVSDTGSIDIGGTLNASGVQAGSIWLAAGDRLDVSGTLTARASAAHAGGGRVDLYALDADGDDPTGTADVVNLFAGSLIDVTAGPGGSGGDIFVHGRRLDTNGDGQTDSVLPGVLAGDLAGAGRAQLVATRVLRDPNATQFVDQDTGGLVTRVTITSTDIEAWRGETDAFLAGLSSPAAGPLEITAGLQVESSGDLVLRDPWNFMEGWHFGRDLSDPMAPRLGLTGIATLRAGRNVELQADLTDSFSQQFLFGFLPIDAVAGAVARTDGSGAVIEEFVPGSWGYRITAGADLASADVMAGGGPAGALSLGSAVRIRTGTADIDLAASGDVRLGDGAAVYAAGWDRGLSAQLKQAMAPVTEPFALTAYDFFGTFLNGGQFADGGGTVTIASGGSLIAATAPSSITNWLTRVGSGEINDDINLYSTTVGFGAIPTHWGVAYNEFRNGIAAFGGGDLRITVAGNVTNAVVALPTTGRAADGVVADTSTGQILFQPSTRTTEILGGGELELRAGGALAGGQLVIGRGTAFVRTGADTGATGAPQLYVGADADVDWISGGSLQLGGMQDPTVLALSDSQLALMTQLFATIQSTADFDNRFFTYTDGSRVHLTSLGGDVTLDGTGFGTFLPPSLTAVAHGGDVDVVAQTLDFFPAATGTLELLARDNVTGNFVGSTEARIRQSDQDRSLLPSVDRPDIAGAAPASAKVPVHTGDTVPNLIVARDGSIQSRPGNAGFWTLAFAKPATLLAGTDISNVSVRVQHIATDALSSFQAGRDIVQGDLRDNTGRFDPNDRRIFEIWGPGSAEFVAARNISLGTSAGIETIGNIRNSALSSQGAALRLMAGTGGEPAYERFIDVYLSTAPSAYRDELNAFLAQVEAGRTGFPSSNEEPHPLPIVAGAYDEALARFLDDRGITVVDDDPVGTFRTLDRSVQRAFLTDTLFKEIKDWGTAAETADRADRLNYIRAYTALDTLFELGDPLGIRAGEFPPNAVAQSIQDFLTITDAQAANDAQVALFGALFPQGERRGDISLLLSQVQTLAGGSLSILAPGGDINAGAADADVIDKAPADLGIVTARGGDINIAVDRDLLVNSTRVFALQDDLLIWSSNGNIDAGKGAKTVTSVPDPITRIDPNTGNTIIEFPPAVSGSGLQGENAALFAPRGAVNAGDAGIRTSGNLTIGAVEIVGSDNIDVGGIEIGFSTSEVVAVAPPGASAASTAATKGVDSQAGLLGEEDERGERKILGTDVSFISVEVLSFGDEDCKPEDKDKKCE